MVTHNIALAGPLAEFVVSISSNGSTSTQETIREAVKKDSQLMQAAEAEIDIMEKSETVIDKKESATDPHIDDEAKGKLVMTEEIDIGHVSKDACMCLKNYPILSGLT
jgi:hypothetical protein